MRLTDTIYLSVESFKNRKSRTFLTVLGVSIGIGAVLFLVSLGYGMQEILLNKITTADSLLTLDIASDNKIISIKDDTLDSILKIPNVENVSTQAVFSAQISLNSLTSETTLNVVDEKFFRYNGMQILKGNSLDLKEKTSVVVGERLAELFNLNKDSIVGSKVSLSGFTKTDIDVGPNKVELGKNFTIAGVLAGGDGSQVYVLKKDVPSLVISSYQSAKVKVKDSNSLNVIREELISRGFIVSAISDVVEQANQIFGVIQIILGIFGVVAVVVAAISLVNTMTISLLERTQDIGVMRSIGASAADIRNLFLIESTVIGFMGGVLGIILGFMISYVINFGMRLLTLSLGGQPVNLFSTPIWFLVFILIFATFVGFIAGIMPAYRAGKLHPLMALRYK